MISFFMKIEANNNLFNKTERVWKRTSPYQFLTLLRAFEASIYFLQFDASIYLLRAFEASIDDKKFRYTIHNTNHKQESDPFAHAPKVRKVVLSKKLTAFAVYDL